MRSIYKSYNWRGDTIRNQVEEEKDELERLKDISFWRERLKVNTSVKYVYVFLFIINIIDLFVRYNLPINFTNYLLTATMILTIFFALNIVKKIKYSFQEILIENSSIFKSRESFRKYNKYLISKYHTKKELFIPIILYLIWFPISFISNFESIITESYGITNPDWLFLGHLLRIGASIVWYSIALIWILIVGSVLVIFITTFICINKLGSREFRLRVTYEDLKIGAFEEIGKFIISLSIPAILLGSFFSIVGLLYIFIVKNFLYGYLMLTISLLITFIFAILLYKNTIHIHEAIVDFKTKLKKDLIEQIQEITLRDKNVSEIKEEYMIYSTIYNLHDYYEKVDDINDWPFNPTSIKKLLVTFSSSVLPFLLSFIGIA